jgi:THO complex subunit 2
MRPWLDILRISLLPSLSASNVTAAFDIEIWRLLKLLPYATRYSLYGEWRDSTTNARMGRNPCLIAAAAASEATRAVKQALSRVTAQKVVLTSDKNKNVQQDRGPARTLAKLCHSNPCALWATAVIQVKNYANIGQSIIDAGRYMTQLSYDVATFTILDTLSNDTASRLNANGTGIADWLQRMST